MNIVNELLKPDIPYKEFVVDDWKETPKSVGVRIKRNDGVILNDYEYFPKSQIEYIINGLIMRIKIPN